MAVLPLESEDDMLVAALSAAEMPPGNMADIGPAMRAGALGGQQVRGADTASLSSNPGESQCPRSAAEREVAIGARDVNGDNINYSPVQAVAATAEEPPPLNIAAAAADNGTGIDSDTSGSLGHIDRPA